MYRRTVCKYSGIHESWCSPTRNARSDHRDTDSCRSPPPRNITLGLGHLDLVITSILAFQLFDFYFRITFDHFLFFDKRFKRLEGNLEVIEFFASEGSQILIPMKNHFDLY